MPALIATPKAASSRTLSPLASVRAGQIAIVERVELDADDAALLCAMGLCEGAHLRVCRSGEPFVVAVGGISPEKCHCGGSCRVGISRALAKQILVHSLEQGAAHERG